ncbi:MAG: hypothetical protein ACXWZP_08420, partial [Gaiellaceae bacterium]
MKRLLLTCAALALLAAPTALGATPATGAKTMHGTVVAKDRAHHGLVVASPAGVVRTIKAPGAFAKTDVGRRVVVRYRLAGGALPVALGVTRGRDAGSALVRGTVMRLGRGHAVLSAGGSALSVSLATAKRQRVLSSSGSGPELGDKVKVEVEIDDDGSLEATGVTVTSTGAPSTQSASEGELEVRGTVTAVTPAVIVKTGTSVVVTCIVPAGATPTGIAVGDLVEVKCDLIGGQWTLRKAHGEDDEEHDEEHSGHSSHGSKVKVLGTLTSLDPANLTVKRGSGELVTCDVPAGVSLTGLTAGQLVEMKCRTINGV